MRFFRSVSALTYEEAQRLCNVDFEKDVAFVAVVGPRAKRRTRLVSAVKSGLTLFLVFGRSGAMSTQMEIRADNYKMAQSNLLLAATTR
jgi:hypothetical protein